jgi:hypothetical protein
MRVHSKVAHPCSRKHSAFWNWLMLENSQKLRHASSLSLFRWNSRIASCYNVVSIGTRFVGALSDRTNLPDLSNGVDFHTMLTPRRKRCHELTRDAPYLSYWHSHTCWDCWDHVNWILEKASSSAHRKSSPIISQWESAGCYQLNWDLLMDFSVDI